MPTITDRPPADTRTEDKAAEHPLLSLDFTGEARMFDWSETVLARSGLTKGQKSYRMSDDDPLWAEFEA